MNFHPNRQPIEELKVQKMLQAHQRIFSLDNCPIANKKLMKCPSRPAIANAMLPADGFI
jgi:hypothetical protein